MIAVVILVPRIPVADHLQTLRLRQGARTLAHPPQFRPTPLINPLPEGVTRLPLLRCTHNSRFFDTGEIRIRIPCFHFIPVPDPIGRHGDGAKVVIVPDEPVPPARHAAAFRCRSFRPCVAYRARILAAFHSRHVKQFAYAASAGRFFCPHLVQRPFRACRRAQSVWELIAAAPQSAQRTVWPQQRHFTRSSPAQRAICAGQQAIGCSESQDLG